MDLVSVIIPFYRGREWLITALDSVINQTYMDIEIIVVDDGSEIEINDLLDIYPQLRIIHKTNGGPASARNEGIKVAKGEYLAFLDSDDIWKERKLEIQLQYMKTKGYRWSATSYTKFRDCEECNPEKDQKVKLKEKNEMPLWQMFSSTRIATPTVVIEKKLLDENPELRYIENMRFGEDTCFWFSMAMKSNFGYIDIPLARVRVHGSNAAGNCYTQIIARSDIYDFLKHNYSDTVDRMPVILRLGYAIASIEKKLLLKLATDKEPKIIAKVLYAIPWTIFRISSYLFGGIQ